MRLCLPARMGGGGKAESLPLARASGRAATATRGNYSALGNERAKPLAFPLNKGNGAGQAPSAAMRHIGRHPCTVRRQPDALRAGLWASGRPVSREARVPAGQNKKAAPSRSAAGKSVTLENPAHLFTLLIVTGTAKTTGLVRVSE